jgi:hypothetical protein
MKIVLGLILSLAVLLGGALAALFVLAAMTGCDLRIRSNMVVLVGCMGVVAALVAVGLWLAWRMALR